MATITQLKASFKILRFNMLNNRIVITFINSKNLPHNIFISNIKKCQMFFLVHANNDVIRSQAVNTTS